ncbi:protein lifeguard 1-like [Anopheles moucheti]|uniref:protein lifeguard 1-like n=1 Tax=Anopheles moucheti TaxID=186751 RepID=UPI0022F04495|nr:protein lifeguard 1-like [Anopheles moucheti]
MQGDQQQFFSSSSYPQQPGYGIGFAPQPGVQPGMQPGMHPSAFASSAGTPEGYSPYDAESASVKGFDFNDQTIRRGFIRKVYAILTLQLSITFVFVAFVTNHNPTKLWVRQHPGMFWVAFIVMFGTLIAISCCGELRRKAPANFMFLGLFTFAESFLVSMVAASYSSQEVMIAFGITAAVCLGLTLFAFQTKWDFTMMGGILFTAVLVLFLFGLIAMFIPGKTIQLIYSSLGALLFSFYLVYDTQIMMGGNHKFSISPEEYVFAALCLYLDVINIFLHILSIIGASRN